MCAVSALLALSFSPLPQAKYVSLTLDTKSISHRDPVIARVVVHNADSTPLSLHGLPGVRYGTCKLEYRTGVDSAGSPVNPMQFEEFGGGVWEYTVAPYSQVAIYAFLRLGDVVTSRHRVPALSLRAAVRLGRGKYMYSPWVEVKMSDANDVALNLLDAQVDHLGFTWGVQRVIADNRLANTLGIIASVPASRVSHHLARHMEVGMYHLLARNMYFSLFVAVARSARRHTNVSDEYYDLLYADAMMRYKMPGSLAIIRRKMPYPSLNTSEIDSFLRAR
jgi:hypothetical protein